MPFNQSDIFTKENLDLYFKEISKEYKRLGGRNTPVEVILIGGAAIIENYGFREMTTDIDAIFPSISIMKDAINHIGDKYKLPNGWLNSDFIKTDSYSPHLIRFSVPYKTFNQVLQVRTVTGEYLIAMKLRAGRKYKNDLSDIIGILAEHNAAGDPINYAKIDTAVKNLYGSWNSFPADSIAFLHGILEQGDFSNAYSLVRDNEIQAKNVLLDFQNSYPDKMEGQKIDYILESHASRNHKASLLAQLEALKRDSDQSAPK